MEDDKYLIFVGDIHGNLRELIWNITIQHRLKNVDLVICGDFGVGFGRPKSIEHLYNRVKNKLDKFNITVYTIRGNHDNPSFFDGKHNFERLIFLEDYKPVEIQGLKILPIGGAVSIDQEWRENYNKRMEKYGSQKRSWWSDEVIKKIDFKELPSKVDIIVSHCAPISFTPIFSRTNDIDLDIWKKILNERNYLEKIKNEVNYKYWIFGHYHKSTSGNFGDKLYRCLDIMELFEFRY